MVDSDNMFTVKASPLNWTEKSLPGDRIQSNPEELEARVQCCPAASQTGADSASHWFPACDNVAVWDTNMMH